MQAGRQQVREASKQADRQLGMHVCRKAKQAFRQENGNAGT